MYNYFGGYERQLFEPLKGWINWRVPKNQLVKESVHADE